MVGELPRVVVVEIEHGLEDPFSLTVRPKVSYLANVRVRQCYTSGVSTYNTFLTFVLVGNGPLRTYNNAPCGTVKVAR